MSFGRQFQRDILNLILRNTDIAGLGDASGVQGSAVAGSVHVSLHTADPDETGNQTTNEIGYTSYAREALARSTTWAAATDASPAVAALASNLDFTTGTGGSGTATHFMVGEDLTGTGKQYFRGTVTPNIVCGDGVTPRLNATNTQLTLQ